MFDNNFWGVNNTKQVNKKPSFSTLSKGGFGDMGSSRGFNFDFSPSKMKSTTRPSTESKLSGGVGFSGMNFGGPPKKEILPDAGNQPEPTSENLDYYRKNREKIVPSIVKSTLKKHPSDVLHGSQSLNMLIPNYTREPRDWDTYSPNERQRALAYERAIDRSVGANIAQTEYIQIPKVSSKDDNSGTSRELYRVVTPQISNDAEIDVMDKPSDLKTIRDKGITHESIEEQYIKAVTRKSMQVFKAQKALEDQRAIETYWETKGITPPVIEGVNESFRMRKSMSMKGNFKF